MKIGVLKAGVVLPDYQPTHGDFDAMFLSLFARIMPAAQMHVFHVRDGHYPAAIDDCDGYVITGSADSVYDDEPWIAELIDFVRELVDQKIKTLGICFGHQIIAHALDGTAELAAAGWGVGIHRTEVTPVRPWMAEGTDGLRLLHSHRDQVTSLPTGAEPILTSSFCPNAGFVMGDHVFTLQGHPEFTRDFSRDLMELRREMLGDAYEPGVASLAGGIDDELVGAWIVGFFNS